jgi:hypothetical protein
MNKKNLLCTFLAFFAFQSILAKDNSSPSIQISFFSTHGKPATNSDFEHDYQYCMELLKNLSDIQKKRKLTLEEIIMALQIVVVLYNSNNNEHTKKIEILLYGKDKLILPYSSQIFELLTQQGSDTSESDTN